MRVNHATTPIQEVRLSQTFSPKLVVVVGGREERCRAPRRKHTPSDSPAQPVNVEVML